MTREDVGVPTPPAGQVVPSDVLTLALRKISEGLGCRSATLHADLGPELRDLFQVPEWDTDTLRTLARVTWQLNRLISRLPSQDLQLVARVSYNLGVPAIREFKLGRRRVWLHETARKQSAAESQRDLRRTIVPTFAASLRTDPPPSPSDTALAQIMAREIGGPADDHLPLPLPPSIPRSSTMAPRSGLLIVGAIATLLLGGGAVASSLGTPAGSDAPSTPPAVASSEMTASSQIPSGTVTEIGGNRNGSPTFRDPFKPAETGPDVAFLQEVEVTCKVQAFTFDSLGPDGYWYRIASPPWHNDFYAPAITFLNGDPVDGPYEHNFDPAVPDC